MNNEESDIIQRLTDYIYFEEKLTDSLKYAYVVEEMQLKKKVSLASILLYIICSPSTIMLKSTFVPISLSNILLSAYAKLQLSTNVCELYTNDNICLLFCYLFLWLHMKLDKNEPCFPVICLAELPEASIIYYKKRHSTEL